MCPDGVWVADDQLGDAEITYIEFVDTTSAAGDDFAMFEPEVEKISFGRIRLPSCAPPCPAPLTLDRRRESAAAEILAQVFGEVTPNTPDTPQPSPSPRASVTRSPVRANLTRAFSLAPARVTRAPVITQSRSLPAQPLFQTSREIQADPEADPIPLLEPTRPSSSRSRKSFETEKTVTGRGKAGRFNMKNNVNKLMKGAEIISETESVKDKWKQWNIINIRPKLRRKFPDWRDQVSWILSANHVEEQ